MKIRTLENLSDFLSNEKAWRKKELYEIHSLILSPNFKGSKQAAMIRAGVAMLYAHWEGFIKIASNAYLEFVVMQKLLNNELAPNFLALSARKLLSDAKKTNKIGFHIAVSNFYLNEINNRSSLVVNGSIKTQSNLSSSVLKEIIETLGLDYSVFVTRENLIDESLLDKRNKIAHGDYLGVTVTDFMDLHEKVLEMMEWYSNQIENAAAQKKYKQTPSPTTLASTSQGLKR